MSSDGGLPRDLVGYGRHPPDPQWPGSARLAVNFVINFEEGSEPSIRDGFDLLWQERADAPKMMSTELGPR